MNPFVSPRECCVRTLRSMHTRALAAVLVLPLVAATCLPAVRAQSVDAVATFHNIGVEVTLRAPPADHMERIAVSIRRTDSAEAFRPAHPLVPIGPLRYAGSVVQLDAGTAYDIRLHGPIWPDKETTLTVRTRSDTFPKPDGRLLHVSATEGSPEHDGLSQARPLPSLGAALDRVRAGDTVLMHAGRYLEGDLELTASGTERNPIVIRAAAGDRVILDGTDPDFNPSWRLFDGDAGVYRTALRQRPTNAYIDGEQLFHYRSLYDLRSRRWDQPCGYAVDGEDLYVRFPDGSEPSAHRITVPRHTTGLTVTDQSHVQIVGIEFCYYGYGTYHRGIHLDAADQVLIDRCRFHHTGMGVTMKYEATFNTVQNCTFTESPVDTWSWHAVKSGGVGYESGGVGIYSSDVPNRGNVIRYNAFRHMFDAAGLYTGSLAGPTTNLDFYGNLIEDCADDGIETDGAGINNRIYGNLFRRFLTGISVAPCAPGPTYIFRNVLTEWRPVGEFGGYPFKFNVRSKLPIRWIFLYHNTCATDVPEQHGFLFKQYSQWSDIVSRNNIFAGTAIALESWSETNPVDFDYDLLHCDPGKTPIRWARVPYDTIESFANATGQETHGILAPPAFQLDAHTPWTLRPDSPCVDAGAPIPGFNDGWRGNAPDIGAAEYPQPPEAMHAGPRPPQR